MNPFGVMPVFLSMTSDLDQKSRTKTALKAVVIAFFTLMLFMFTGDLIFRFFGISINSLRIVGGIIFFMVGQDMLQARLTRTKIKNSEIKQYVNDISITPLAIPMICGPGAITNAIVLMEDAYDSTRMMILVGTILLVLAIMFFVLYGGSRLSKLLGQTGLNVLMRIMGLIVMVIAVEFFFSGLKPILQDIFIK
ncbi:MAG: NAAT family transporter [Bacteroidetes bacterium]|nr:NAAT family transporter [Bacteroidota bacterium]MBT6837021.1 NAAT family transporter [Bacteroidota bacterium]MBT7040710.1 NAAT family transporter [Bacteroidota bacterium]